MAIPKAIIVSLALGLVGSNVLGAAVMEEVKDQATTTASSIDDLYNTYCVGGYCQWRCKDDSDWCWIASIDDAVMTDNPDPHWMTCKKPADCAKELKGLRDQGRAAMCRSTTAGYRSLVDLTCVAKQDQASWEKWNKELKEQEEALRKAREARQARLNMISAKLPPGGLDAVKEQVFKEMYPGLKKPGGSVGDVNSGNFDPELVMNMGAYMVQVQRVSNAVEDTALALSEEDLKLPPEALKSKLVEHAKGEMSRLDKLQGSS